MEGEEAPEVSLATGATEAKETPMTPISVPRGSHPPLERDNEGVETNSRTTSASPQSAQAQLFFEKGISGGDPLIPEVTVRDIVGAKEPQRSEPPPNVKAESVPEASTRHSGAKAVSFEEQIPNTEDPSTSRPRSPFEILGRGLRGCPMEARQNLIPKDFLGGARVTSPEKIVQGIMISHYQVVSSCLRNFPLTRTFINSHSSSFFFLFFFF
jgi:hypothetical protein